jgi:peptide/nickel transport system ATP-binding protein
VEHTPAPGTPALRIAGQRVSFGTTEITHGIDLLVRPRTVMALVGESGSGKSVTALSLLGLAGTGSSATGSARLADGTELIGAEAQRLRRVRGKRIGVVFQQPMNAFDPMYRIGHTLAEALRAHGERVTREQAAGRSAAALRAAGLAAPERILASYPHELSGGQLQRAMIALATIHDPELLIADEPTTALDVTVQADILDLLRHIATERAVLLITHDMGVVAQVADEISVMKDGRIVETGAAAEVFNRPRHAYTRKLLDAVPRLGAVAAAASAEAGSGTDPNTSDEAPAAELSGGRVEFRGKRTTVAVDDVDLCVPAGTVVALVGESGSGKSTIANVLIGAQRLTAGTARIAGSEVRTGNGRDQRRLRARIGTVFQDPAGSLNPRRTVAAQLAQPLQVHTDLGRTEIDRRVNTLLDDVQLPAGFAARMPHELSGGQKQRVAIARALALRPRLLIADEPTSALDVSVQAGVLDLLRDLHAEYGFASLFISHDLAVVEQIAEQVVVLRHGRVVERGATLDVLRRPQDDYTRELIAAVPEPVVAG